MLNKWMVFVYITCKNQAESEKISLNLLKKRLIACSNFFPIKSFYWWQGKIVKSKEFAILAKTKKKNYLKIKKYVQKIHSYTVPCICMVDSIDSEPFKQWVENETS